MRTRRSPAEYLYTCITWPGNVVGRVRIDLPDRFTFIAYDCTAVTDDKCGVVCGFCRCRRYRLRNFHRIDDELAGRETDRSIACRSGCGLPWQVRCRSWGSAGG